MIADAYGGGLENRPAESAFAPQDQNPNADKLRKTLFSRGLAFDHSTQRGALAITGLTPTVQDSVNQVVRHGVVLSDALMALLAFPRALENICYLFEYSGHYVFR
jgi:hypothetical protein